MIEETTKLIPANAIRTIVIVLIRLEIVPENDKLIIEAKIEPKDIDDLQLGLPAAFTPC